MTCPPLALGPQAACGELLQLTLRRLLQGRSRGQQPSRAALRHAMDYECALFNTIL